MKEHNAKAYLVNTGWNGTGKRISLKETRAIIDAILDGSIDKAPTKHIPIMNLTVPVELPNVSSDILDPRNTYEKVEHGRKKPSPWPASISRTLRNIVTMRMPVLW